MDKREEEYEIIYTEYEDEVFPEDRDPYESDREYNTYLKNDPYDYIGFDYDEYDADRKLEWHIKRKWFEQQRNKENK